jgi:hypothetical protein
MPRKPRKRKPATELNLMRQRFVNAYASDPRANGARAAVVAGYSAKNAAKTAYNLLHTPAVKAAIETIRASLVESGKFDAQAAMRRLDEAAAFARATSNATALARCVELQLRLHGLLIDRAEIRVEPLDIAGTLYEARKRVSLPTAAPAEAEYSIVDPFE